MRSVKIVTAVTFATMLAFTILAQGQSDRAGTQLARQGSIGRGRVINVPSSNVPYAATAEEIAAHEKLLAAKSKHLAPPLGPHTTAAEVALPGGPPTEDTNDSLQPLTSPSALWIFRKSLVNSTCSGCAQSTVNEPSVANAGRTVVETSNWNIAYSVKDGGATWLNQNPYALSPGYCCDTQVVYDQDRDLYILLLLDYAGEGASTNGLTISLAPSMNPTSWCTYTLNGANFGEGATDTLDYPKIAISNNFLFLTWNDYPPNSAFSASGLARLSLDSLAACGSAGIQYLTRSTEFTFALAQQPSTHNQFYWVSNWMLDGTTNGSNLRIFHWADNSGTYFYNTIGINPYPFGTAACGTPNWCSRLDPRSESVVITPAEYRAQANSAFAGDQILEVAASAGPSSFSNGNNYVVYNYFKLNSLAYIGNDQTYSTSETFAYPACAVNERGYVGCALSFGLNSPAGLILIQDDVNPTQPWGYSTAVAGISGASAWGDYNMVNLWHPTDDPFETVLWNVNGTTVQPYYIVFGRYRDLGGYVRFKER